VAEELIRLGVERTQIRVVGCTDNERANGRPTDAAGHQANQRVEVIQTQEQVPGDAFNQSSAGTP